MSAPPAPQTSNINLINEIYKRYVIPECKHHFGRMLKHWKERDWSIGHLIALHKNHDVTGVAFEHFQKRLAKYSVKELTESLLHGYEPNSTKKVEGLYYIIWSRRMCDEGRKQDREIKRQRRLAEKQEAGGDASDKSRKNDLLAKTATIEAGEFIDFIDVVFPPNDLYVFREFPGRPLPKSTIIKTVLLIQVEGNHVKAPAEEGHDTILKEQRLAELLEFPWTGDTGKKLHNSHQYWIRKAKELAEGFHAWSSFGVLCRQFADLLFKDNELITWFKHVECMKLSQRVAMPKLRWALRWPHPSNDEANRYEVVGCRYRQEKTDFLSDNAMVVQAEREQMEKETGEMAKSDPFADRYAMTYFALTYDWPAFLRD